MLAADGQPEIEYLDLALDDQNVVRLEVAVNDAPPMQIGQRLQHLDQQVKLAVEGVALTGGEDGLGAVQ